MSNKAVRPPILLLLSVTSQLLTHQNHNLDKIFQCGLRIQPLKLTNDHLCSDTGLLTILLSKPSSSPSSSPPWSLFWHQRHCPLLLLFQILPLWSTLLNPYRLFSIWPTACAPRHPPWCSAWSPPLPPPHASSLSHHKPAWSPLCCLLPNRY